MGTITKDYGTGGSGLIGKGPSGSKRFPAIADLLRDVASDLVAMKAEEAISRGNALVVDITSSRTKFIATLTALDGDSGVTDTDFAATQSPAALTAAAILTTSQIIAQLNAVRVDLIALRAKMITFVAKLDADAGVTDTNYAALWTPAALTATAAITTLAQVAVMVNQLIVDRAALAATYAGILAKLDADGTVNLTTYLATHAAAAPTAGAMTALLTIAG
jgi:hypothetical protein